MLVRDNRTSWANGAFGWHDRQDSARMETSHGRIAMSIERAQVDRVRGAAGWAAHPQEPKTRGDRAAPARSISRLGGRRFHKTALILA
jgi:hypothetical protein